MEAVVAKIVPIVVTIIVLAAIMVMMMGIGWISGKLIRKILGIGGN